MRPRLVGTFSVLTVLLSVLLTIATVLAAYSGTGFWILLAALGLVMAQAVIVSAAATRNQP